jgi:hypothetical protein
MKSALKRDHVEHASNKRTFITELVARHGQLKWACLLILGFWKRDTVHILIQDLKHTHTHIF